MADLPAMLRAFALIGARLLLFKFRLARDPEIRLAGIVATAVAAAIHRWR